MACCHQHIRHSSACSCNSPPPPDHLLLQSILSLLLQHYTTPTSAQFTGSTCNPCCLEHSLHHKQKHPEQQESQTKCPILSSLLQRIDLLLQSSSPSSATSLPLRDLAARTIQARFRAFLVRISRAFRNLNDLTSVKSLLDALKPSFPTQKRLDFLSFSREAMCLIRRLETTRGYDKRTRDIKSLILGDFAQFVKQVEEVCLRRNEVSSLMLNSLRIVWNDGKTRVSYVGRESEGVDHEANGSKHCNLERDEKRLIDDMKARIERIHQMSDAVEDKGGYKWVGKSERVDLNGEHELQSSVEKPFRFIEDKNATMLYNFDEYQKEPMSGLFSNAKMTKYTVEKQQDDKEVESDGEENHAEPIERSEVRDEENGDNDGVSQDSDGKGSNKNLSPINVGNARKTEDSTDKLHAYGERLESLESDVEENLARSVKSNEGAENEDETESEGCEDEIENEDCEPENEIENEGCEYENEIENKGFEDKDETEGEGCEDEIESGDCEYENGIENEGCEYVNEIEKRVSKTRMKLKVKVMKMKVVKSVNLRMKQKRRGVEYENGIENKYIEDEDETEGESCEDEIESEDCESGNDIENDGLESENEIENKSFEDKDETEGESCESEIESEDCESENEIENKGCEDKDEIENEGCEEENETESEGSEDDDDETEYGDDEGSEQRVRSPWEGGFSAYDDERNKRVRYLRNVHCYNCGKRGHVIRNCWYGATKWCQLCNEFGHARQVCGVKLMRSNDEGSEQRATDISTENGDDEGNEQRVPDNKMRYWRNVVCYNCGNRGHIALDCTVFV